MNEISVCRQSLRVDTDCITKLVWRVRLRTHGCVGVNVQWNRHELSKIRVIIAKWLDDSSQTLISILNIYKFREKWSNYFFVNAKMIMKGESWKHAQFRYSWTMHAYPRLHLCVVSLLLALQEASTSLSNHSTRWSWFKEFTKIDDSIQPNQTLYHLFQSQFCDVGEVLLNNFLKNLIIIVATNRTNFCSRRRKLVRKLDTPFTNYASI